MLIEVVRLEKLSDWANALRLARTTVAPFSYYFACRSTSDLFSWMKQ